MLFTKDLSIKRRAKFASFLLKLHCSLLAIYFVAIMQLTSCHQTVNSNISAAFQTEKLFSLFFTMELGSFASLFFFLKSKSISSFLLKVSKNRKEGRNPDNNFIGFWEKRCLHKILSVFTDLYEMQIKKYFFYRNHHYGQINKL